VYAREAEGAPSAAEAVGSIVMRRPKVTVTMPVYNAAPCLGQSVESVLRQDFKDFELVIYDDGSTDRSYQIAKHYARIDSRIRIYRHSKNRGVGYVRNQMLSLAFGQYIAPHDADDVMLAKRLRAGVEILDCRPEVGIVFGHALMAMNGNTNTVKSLFASSIQGKDDRNLEKSGKVYTYPIFPHGSALFRRRQAIKAGGYEEELRVGEDKNLFWRLWGKTGFYFLDQYMYVYIRRRRSLTQPYVDRKGRFIQKRFTKDLPLPLLTVAIPIYNAERYLSQSIESVLKQSFTNFEVFLYDDGSIDQSYRIARMYQKIDPRIRLFRGMKNLGVAHARNKILQRARGKYIALHDADDIMLAERLKTEIDILEKKPSTGIVFSGMLLMDGNGKRVIGRRIPSVPNSKGDRSLKRSGLVKAHCRASNATVMFRKDLADRIGNYDESLKVGSDADFFRRAWDKTDLYFINRFFHLCRIHRDSLTERNAEEKKIQRLEKKARQKKFDAVKNYTTFSFHRWQVKIFSEKKNYLRVVKQYLPYYFRARRAEPKPQESIRLHIHYRNGREPDLHKELNERARNFLARRGICIFKDGEEIFRIYINQSKKRTDTWLYHCGFLFPLHRVFRDYKCVLIHGALVSRNGLGLLIVGGDGVGKSTLAALLVEAGFQYFSDEHALLSFEDGAVMGLSFANNIGIIPKARAHFQGLQKAMRWNGRLGKFFLNPQVLASGAVGKTCRIRRILFPTFAPERRSLIIRKLGSRSALKKLLRDDYVVLHSTDKREQAFSKFHCELLTALARQAKNYSVAYGKTSARALAAHFIQSRGGSA